MKRKHWGARVIQKEKDLKIEWYNE